MPGAIRRNIAVARAGVGGAALAATFAASLIAGKDPRLAGARTIEVEAPLGVLPWFTRCGTRPLRD